MNDAKKDTGGKQPEPQLLFFALSSELRSFAAAAIRDARMIVSPNPEESRLFDELIAALSGPGLHRDQVLSLLGADKAPFHAMCMATATD